MSWIDKDGCCCCPTAKGASDFPPRCAAAIASEGSPIGILHCAQGTTLASVNKTTLSKRKNKENAVYLIIHEYESSELFEFDGKCFQIAKYGVGIVCILVFMAKDSLLNRELHLETPSVLHGRRRKAGFRIKLKPIAVEIIISNRNNKGNTFQLPYPLFRRHTCTSRAQTGHFCAEISNTNNNGQEANITVSTIVRN